ncbi:IclR family transcriptional regulator domain-containing protein [Yinghuangia aomiensis]
MSTPGSPTGSCRATRSRGWGANDNEVTDGTRAVGAALRGAGGVPVGALVVVGPSTRFRKELMPGYGELVARIAADWEQIPSPQQ